MNASSSRRRLPRIAALLLGLAASSIAGASRADGPLSVDASSVVPLSLRPGDGLVVRGSVRTSHDGTVFDAATHTQGAVTELGGLFDLAAGGLRLVEFDSTNHVVKLMATGEEAPGCRAFGHPGPCLVPRTERLAHERLLTVAEFQRTLVGALDTATLARPDPLVAPGTLRAVGRAAVRGLGALVALSIVALGLVIARSRRRSPMGHVHAAAHAARAAARSDPTMAKVQSEIDELVARAETLERARRHNERRRRKIDRAEIARAKLQWAASSAPEAAEVCRWLAAEGDEADRLDRDIAASAAGIEQIATSLRVIALSGREHRGVRVRALDSVGQELAIRDRALAESDAAAE